MNDDTNKAILEAALKNLEVSTFVKPKTTSIAIGIERIDVLDHYTKAEPSSFFAIDFQHPLSNPNEPMISLKLDVNPPDEGVDIRLAAKTQPVLINFSKVRSLRFSSLSLTSRC